MQRKMKEMGFTIIEINSDLEYKIYVVRDLQDERIPKMKLPCKNYALKVLTILKESTSLSSLIHDLTIIEFTNGILR